MSSFNPNSCMGLEPAPSKEGSWKMAQTGAIVGIDVCKDKLDVAIRSAKVAARFANNPAGHKDLLRWLAQHDVRKAVMEATAGYEIACRKALMKADLEVVVVDPKRVRHFAKSAGRLAKNDAIDAQMIAWFGEVFDDLTGQPQDDERQELGHLVSARRALVRMQEKVENWSGHERPKFVQRVYQALLKVLAAQLDKLDDAIAARIHSTPRFADRAEIIRSVPGFRHVSAAALVALLPELGRVDRQVAAALLGVAPFDDDSGNHHGRRVIMGGRRKLRNLLYMPLVGAATRHNPVLKAHYQRLLTKGKPPKVALIACMRKLIGILNAMLARGEKWDPTRHAVA
jgi:transposase